MSGTAARTWLDLTVAEKFTMSLVPISTRVPSLENAWTQWAQALARKKVCRLQQTPDELLWKNLQEVEDTCRMYSAYAWLGYRMPDFFPSIAEAQQLAREAPGFDAACRPCSGHQ